jgi:hypothetical protein
MSKIELAPDYKNMKMSFLCEGCGAVSMLKRPEFNSSVLFVTVGALFFGATFCLLMWILPTSLGWVQLLLTALGAALGARAGVLLVSRFTQKYVRADETAA